MTHPWTYSTARNEIYLEAHERAAREGVPFAIKLAHVNVPDVCPLTGTALALKKSGQQPDAPVLTTIDAQRGYVPGNVQVVCRAALATSPSTSREIAA